MLSRLRLIPCAVLLAACAAACGSSAPPRTLPSSSTPMATPTEAGESPDSAAASSDAPGSDEAAVNPAGGTDSGPVSAAPAEPPAEPAPAADTCGDASSEMQERLMPLWDACYAKMPKRKQVTGTAKVSIAVDVDGNIAKVTYQGTAFPASASRCIVKATRTIAFHGEACAGRSLTAQKAYGPGQH